MVDCFLAVVTLAGGMLLAAVGRVPLGGSEVRGPRVRLAGVILTLFMPLYIAAAVVWCVVEILQAGPGADEAQLRGKLIDTALAYWWVGPVWAGTHILLALALVTTAIRPKERARRENGGGPGGADNDRG